MSRCRLVTIFRFNFILKSVGGSRVTEKRYRSTKQRKNHKNTPFYSNTSYLRTILDIHLRIFHVAFTQGHDYMVLTTTSFKWTEHVKDDIYLQAACLPLLQVFPVVPAGHLQVKSFPRVGRHFAPLLQGLGIHGMIGGTKENFQPTRNT